MKANANIEPRDGDVHVDGDSMLPWEAAAKADELLAAARIAMQWRKDQRRKIMNAARNHGNNS